MTHASITIQITTQSQPSTPSFLGEVAAFAQVLTYTGILDPWFLYLEVCAKSPLAVLARLR